MNKKIKIVGLILNGGLSRRMGSDKAIKKINNESLLELVIKRAVPQVDILLINSNKTFKCKYQIIPDCMEGNLGPLVGILSGLKFIKKNKTSSWLAVFPVDSPFFPKNMIQNFLKNISDEQIIMATSKNKVHPVFSMWNIDVSDFLEDFLKCGGRKIDLFSKKFKTRLVNFPFFGYDPFFNVNNKKDLEEAKLIYNNLMEGIFE